MNIEMYKNKTGKIISGRISVYLGKDPNGKEIRKKKTVKVPSSLTNSKAKKYLNEKGVDFERTCKLEYERVHTSDDDFKREYTFREYAEKVMDVKKNKGLKTRTLDRYEELLVRINVAIGDIPINKIKAVHLAAFYESLSQPGVNKNTGGGLSAKTIREHHNIISSVLGRAALYGLISSNPADVAKEALPKINKVEIEIFTEEQVKEIRQLAESETKKWKTIINIMAVIGPRRGEILGLTEEDLELDLDTPVMHIRRAVLYSSKRGIFIDEPKSNSSKRTLGIPSQLVTILKEFLVWRQSEQEKYGDMYHQSAYLFTSNLGEHMHPDTITDYLRKFRKKYNLSYHINPHKFRHTVASILIYKGIDIVTVSRYLGHSSPDITAKIYAHLLEDALVKASDVITEVLLE